MFSFNSMFVPYLSRRASFMNYLLVYFVLKVQQLSRPFMPSHDMFGNWQCQSTCIDVVWRLFVFGSVGSMCEVNWSCSGLHPQTTLSPRTAWVDSFQGYSYVRVYPPWLTVFSLPSVTFSNRVGKASAKTSVNTASWQRKWRRKSGSIMRKGGKMAWRLASNL